MGPLFSLAGKVALVTGGSRGIGEAIAGALARAGAAVALASRKLEGVEAAAARIRAAGGRALAIAAHTGKPDDVRALVARATAELGPIDVLVNNAATNPYFGPLLQTPDAAWDKTFEVNLRGYFLCAREVIAQLVARKAPGSIVNVASIVAMRGAPAQGVYAMTKAAVISMTQTLAVELGSAGIRVNAIAPGLVETHFAAALVQNPQIRGPWVARTPLGRHAQPEEIAGAAVYLASDASSFVTGQTLVVDGGVTIG